VESMALLAGQAPVQAQLESMLRDKDVNVRVSAIASIAIFPGDRTIGGPLVSLGGRESTRKLEKVAKPHSWGASPLVSIIYKRILASTYELCTGASNCNSFIRRE
jgi:hypothetical protein